MNKLWLCLAVLGLLANPLVAQDPGTKVEATPTPPANPVPAVRSSDTRPSSYEQETSREYMIRQARERTAARVARIEGMKWLGHSPVRPVVSPMPFSSHAPSWVSVYPQSYWGAGYWSAAGGAAIRGFAP